MPSSLEGVSLTDMGFVLRAAEPAAPPPMLPAVTPPTEPQLQRQGDIRNVSMRNKTPLPKAHGGMTRQQKGAAAIEARLHNRRLKDVAA